VHDHPGLQHALATQRPVIGFFCFDESVLSDQCTELWGPESIRRAVACLQEQLEQLNCPLVIRKGDTAGELLDVVQRTGAAVVACESEVEYRWLHVQDAVKAGERRLTNPQLQ
jgi:deoxyribodipyrimidine photolyase